MVDCIGDVGIGDGVTVGPGDHSQNLAGSGVEGMRAENGRWKVDNQHTLAGYGMRSGTA